MLKSTNTIFAVWTSTSDSNALVLIREDAEGINTVKFIDYDSNDSVFAIVRALEAITGDEYEVGLISKSRFIERFGKRIARAARLVE